MISRGIPALLDTNTGCSRFHLHTVYTGLGPLYRVGINQSNMGAEQSQSEYSWEFSDPEETWERYGFRIKSTTPHVPGHSKVRMLEDTRLTVLVECKKPVPLRNLKAYCWTDAYHKFNPEGIFHKINMPYVEGSRAWDDWGLTTYKFSTVVYFTNNAECRLTFLVRLGNITQWAEKPEVDHIVDVLSPRDANNFTKNLSFAQITKNYYIGNFLAVRYAKDMNVELIVRFCDKVPKKYKTKEGDIPQIFHTFNKNSAASSEISADKLQETVGWLDQNRDNFSKVLLADEYGLGRVGSSMVALIFASNPSLTYEEAFQFVLSRKEIYCHKGLKSSLLQLYHRE